MEDRVDAMVDVGGGETALTRVIAELPLADSLEEQGIRVVVVHMVGPDAADLDYLDSFEDGGLFAAPATLVVQNAGLVMTGGIDEAFASIYDHRTVGRVRTRGGIVVQMPRLICMNEVTKRRLGFVEAYEGKKGADGTAVAFLDRVRVRNWWTKEVPGALFAEVRRHGSRAFREPQRQRSRVGGRRAECSEQEAPEGRALPSELGGWGFMKKRGGQGGGDCLGRWDFGLAEEIARVEQAARDWGVHIDAVEGGFVGALLKAIEETGKTNLAALGDLEVLFERARREGEADRRRIERMVEAGVNALAMANQATERAGLASVPRRGGDRRRDCADCREDVGRAFVGKPEMVGLEATERNRREPSRIAAWVGAAALAGFIGGGGTMRWLSAGESATRQAVLEAVDRCRVQPRMVRAADGKTFEMCGLADLTTNRPNWGSGEDQGRETTAG